MSDIYRNPPGIILSAADIACDSSQSTAVTDSGERLGMNRTPPEAPATVSIVPSPCSSSAVRIAPISSLSVDLAQPNSSPNSAKEDNCEGLSTSIFVRATRRSSRFALSISRLTSCGENRAHKIKIAGFIDIKPNFRKFRKHGNAFYAKQIRCPAFNPF